MLENIRYETYIELQDLPIQWIPTVELYYPDLPQFPIQYVHVKDDNNRIYGFPSIINFKAAKKSDLCNAEIIFLSNKNLNEDETAGKIVRDELANRFGLSDKVGLQDVIEACNNNKDFESFFMLLWKYISKAYGQFIPYGRFYEEVFSMVRFISAWQPKTGKQSEMRMLYNFLSNFGEQIRVEGKWDHLEFYLLPTYDDLLSAEVKEFPLFGKLLSSMKKMFDIFYTETLEINGKELRYMKRSWPIKGFREITTDLVRQNKITIDDKSRLDLLVDAFNRHPWRAGYFIWSICNINKMNDYRKWNKDDFITFYLTKFGRGCSQKAVACFLQQGFKNEEVLPIDTWVGAFHSYTLGIEDREDFFKAFKKMGKLERAIWLASQANKTNIKLFFYTLWCTRYGTSGGRICREANPLSCYECQLINQCPGFMKIAEDKVYVKKSSDPVPTASSSDARFLIEADTNSVPKRVFKNEGEWKLIDEFSGYILHTQRSTKVGEAVKVMDFIRDLPPMEWHGHGIGSNT